MTKLKDLAAKFGWDEKECQDFAELVVPPAENAEAPDGPQAFKVVRLPADD